jgi:hypothetical protein
MTAKHEDSSGVNPTELEALAALPDAKINTDEMPEVRNWNGAQRGVFFRPSLLAAFDRLMGRNGGEAPRPEDTPD